jgi:ABC-type transport system substrate-binding protein
MRTRLLPALAIPFVLFLLPGCSREDSEYGGSATLSSLTEPESLNPLFYLDTVSPNLGSLIFNSLFALNERLEFAPELAESWKVSDDGRVWTVRLRRGGCVLHLRRRGERAVAGVGPAEPARGHGPGRVAV